MHEQAHKTLETVVRNSRAKLVAFLAAGSGDLAAAEDALVRSFRIGAVGVAARWLSREILKHGC